MTATPSPIGKVRKCDWCEKRRRIVKVLRVMLILGPKDTLICRRCWKRVEK